MEIKLFGADGCFICRQLEQTVFNVLTEMRVAASVDKITDPGERLRYGVYCLPAVMIKGELKASGRVPDRHEFMSWVQEASRPPESEI